MAAERMTTVLGIAIVVGAIVALQLFRRGVGAVIGRLFEVLWEGGERAARAIRGKDQGEPPQ